MRTVSTKVPWSCVVRPERTGGAPAARSAGGFGGFGCADRDAAAVLADALEHDLAIDQREEAVVARLADAGTGQDVGAALADDDRARGDPLAAERLHAHTLRVGVAAVAGRAAALLVRHCSAVLCRLGGRLLLRRARPGGLVRL